jgi:predicted GNAT family N-acyltransferase
MTQKIAFQSPVYMQARQIRHVVFVEEQGVSAEEEYDEFDLIATHFVAIDDTTQEAVGTARWRITEKGVKLERFAVLPTHRNKGVGQSLVRAVLEDIDASPETAGKALYLHAQESAIGLYQKFAFQTVGEPFYEANIRHMKMQRAI